MLQTLVPTLERFDLLPHEASRGYMLAIAAARAAALDAVLGRGVVHYTPPQRVVAAPAKRKAPAARKLTAEAFFDAYQIALRNVVAEYGNRWAILGHGVWASVPSRLRSFTGPRGGKITMRRDKRVPDARFWPDGRIPEELALASASGALTPWVIGYGRDGEHVLMHPMLARQQAAHAEAIAHEQGRKVAA